MGLNAIAVITSPFYNSNAGDSIQSGEGNMTKYLHLVPVPHTDIRSCKNFASRVATRAYAFYSKKKWKQDLDFAHEKGYHDYYKAEGKGHYDDHVLELIIMDRFWTDI